MASKRGADAPPAADQPPAFVLGLHRVDGNTLPGGFVDKDLVNLKGIEPSTFADAEFVDLPFTFWDTDVAPGVRRDIEESFEAMGVEVRFSQDRELHRLIPTEGFDRERFFAALQKMFERKQLKVVRVNRRSDEAPTPDRIPMQRAHDALVELQTDMATILRRERNEDLEPKEKWEILSDTLRRAETPDTALFFFRACVARIKQSNDPAHRAVRDKADDIALNVTDTLHDLSDELADEAADEAADADDRSASQVLSEAPAAPGGPSALLEA